MPKITHTYFDEATDKVVDSDESSIECDMLQCESGAPMKGDWLPEDWTVIQTKAGATLYVCPACRSAHAPSWLK